MAFLHRQVCVGFIKNDDETPVVGTVSCCHLMQNLTCAFFEGCPKCDDLVLLPTVKATVVSTTTAKNQRLKLENSNVQRDTTHDGPPRASLGATDEGSDPD